MKRKKVWGRIKKLHITKHTYKTNRGLTHRYIFQLARNGVTEHIYSDNSLYKVVKYRNKFIKKECPHLWDKVKRLEGGQK